MDVVLRLGGDADDFGSLRTWLAEEDELRGAVRFSRAAINENELGSALDVVSIALGAGGAGTALVRSLTTWLKTRQTSAKITVESEGRSVTVDLKTLEEVRPMLEEILRLRDEA